MKTLKSLGYENVVITGASSGIGAEFARQLHAQGLSVCLIARRQDQLENLAAEFNARRQGSASYLVCDLTDLESAQGIKAAVDFLENQPVDVLINNAGHGSFGYFEELPLEREIAMVRLNIEATMRLAAAVMPKMKQKKCGAIISISSISALQALPYMATYAATKAFNLVHSMGLREELRDFGVRVLTVCPGPTATEFGGVARVPGTISGVFRDPVEIVVSNSIKALVANKAWVIPSWRAKLIALPTIILPRVFSTYCIGKSLAKVLRLASLKK